MRARSGTSDAVVISKKKKSKEMSAQDRKDLELGRMVRRMSPRSQLYRAGPKIGKGRRWWVWDQGQTCGPTPEAALKKSRKGKEKGQK